MMTPTIIGIIFHSMLPYQFSFTGEMLYHWYPGIQNYDVRCNAISYIIPQNDSIPVIGIPENRFNILNTHTNIIEQYPTIDDDESSFLGDGILYIYKGRLQKAGWQLRVE